MANKGLRTCAAEVAKGLGITDEDADEIVERILSYRRVRGAQGRLDNLEADVRAFAKDSADLIKIAAAAQRKKVAVRIIRLDEARTQIEKMKASGLKPSQALEAFQYGDAKGAETEQQSVNGLRLALESDYLHGMGAEIRDKFPHVFELLKRFDDAAPLTDDIVREMYELKQGGAPGRTGNNDAREMAKLLAKYLELSRMDGRRAGADIGKIDGYAGPQHYEAGAMLKEGRAAFVRDIVDGIVPFEGATREEMEKSVDKSFDTITLGRELAVPAGGEAPRMGPKNLASSLEAHRVWHFKDADTWLRIQKKYGQGNVITSILEHQHRMARKVSVMRKMTDNPEGFLRTLMAEEHDKVLHGSKDQKELDALSAPLTGRESRIALAFQNVTGATLVPDDISRAQFWGNVRATKSMSSLGFAMFSSFPDLGTYMNNMRLQGHGVFSGLAKAVQGLFNGRSKAESEYIDRVFGTGLDWFLGSVHGRYTSEDAIRGKISDAQRWFFRLNGQQWWDRNLTGSFMAMTAAHMREHAHLGWDAVGDEFRHFVGLHGIDAPRWEAMRHAVVEGDRMLIPGSIADLSDDLIAPLVAGKVTPDKLAGARRDLELQYRSLLHTEAGFGIVKPDDRTRANILQGTRPGSKLGELLRLVLQFKSFGFAYGQKALFARRGIGGKRDYGALASLVGVTTALGFLRMAVTDTLKNKTQRDYENHPYATGIAALFQGGGFGIYGDFFLAKEDRHGAGFLGDVAGPVPGTIAQLFGIGREIVGVGREAEKGGWLKAVERAAKNVKSDAFYLALNNTPFLNLWYARAAADLTILNWYQEHLTPGTLKRREATMKKDFGQKYLLDPMALTPTSVIGSP